MLQSHQDLPSYRIGTSDPFTRLALLPKIRRRQATHATNNITHIPCTAHPTFQPSTSQSRSTNLPRPHFRNSNTPSSPFHTQTPTRQPPPRMSFLLRRPSPLSTSLRSATRTFSSTTPSQLARLTLVGRLGTDPEVSDTKAGSVIKYAVGTSYGPKDNRQTSWFRVASFAPEGSAQRDYLMGLQKG